MTGIEKRNMVLKEVITPTLKRAGFKKSGLNWWMELEDCYLIIRMQNCRFNGKATGINFEFQFSASANDDIRKNMGLLKEILEYSRLPKLLDRAWNYVLASTAKSGSESGS